MIKNNTKENSTSDDEIDIIELVKYTWDRRGIIFKTIAIFLIIGVLVALFSSKEYTASSTILPQVSSSEGASVSALAAFAGFNLNSVSGGALPPSTYTQIVNSAPFQLDLMYSEFDFADLGKRMSLYEYYTEYDSKGFVYYLKKYTIGLPGLILSALSPNEVVSVDGVEAEDSILTLTEEENNVKNAIKGFQELVYDEKEGTVTLTAVTEDAILSAQLVDRTGELLQKYITEKKVAKAKSELKFVEARLREKRQHFENIQKELALFRDRNQDVTSALAMTNQQQLQTRFNLSFEIYSQLATQYETALIKVKEDTPIYTVVNPVQVPLRPSAPNRTLILAFFIFLGGLVGVGIILGKMFIESVKDRWNEY